MEAYYIKNNKCKGGNKDDIFDQFKEYDISCYGQNVSKRKKLNFSSYDYGKPAHIVKVIWLVEYNMGRNKEPFLR